MFKLKHHSNSSLLLYMKDHWKHCIQCLRLLSSQNQSTSESGPWSLYSQKVSDNVLSKDTHQENVVRHLQEIYNEIRRYERPVIQSQNANSFLKFFRKSKPQKIIAPKGLYIYGSVGGGKTMLMDLFYETVPVRITFCILKEED